MIDPSFPSRDSKVLSDDPRFLGGSASSSPAMRRLRSTVTAVIALALGIALVSWLKAGDEVRSSRTGAVLTTASTSSAGVGRVTRTR